MNEIRMTAKTQYEYDGRVYDSIEELKKGELDIIGRMIINWLDDKVNNLYLDKYNGKYSMHVDYHTRAFEKVISDKEISEQLEHVAIKQQCARRDFENILRRYVWEKGYA